MRVSHFQEAVLKPILGGFTLVCMLAIHSMGYASVDEDHIPQLFSASRAPSAKVSVSNVPVTAIAIELNRELLFGSLRHGDRVGLSFGGANRILEIISRKRDTSGSITVIAQLVGQPSEQKMLLTFDQEHAFGRVLTDRGVWHIRTEAGETFAWHSEAPGMVNTGYGDDARFAPFGGVASEKKSPEAAAASDPVTTIDVLIAYTSGLAAELGGGLQARLNQLMAVANQAHADSGTGVQLRLVHSVEVSYSDTTSNNDALDALTPGESPTVPELADLPNLRNAWGADLVALIRDYHYPEHGGCGLAWVLGSYAQGTVGNGSYGYSVTSDGMDSPAGSNLTYYCSDLTFAHELGHNMGCAHDRANSGFPGVFDYSYGYGFDEDFGTVMSYIDPEVTLFSTPNLTCAGPSACGVAPGGPQSADNTQSILSVRGELAAFRATVVPEIDSCNAEDMLTLANQTVSGVVNEESCGIVVGPQYTVAAGGTVTLTGGLMVELKAGISVQSGGQLSISIDPAVI